MSRIDDLVERRKKGSEEFGRAYEKENDRLRVAVALMRLREEQGLTQRQLAGLSGKPQSTIARIESGAVNTSLEVLAEIAGRMGKRLVISFESR